MQSPPTQAFDISVTNGVISYVASSAMQSTNNLQIIIRYCCNCHTGGGGGSSSALTIDQAYPSTSQSVAASSTFSSSSVLTGSCTRLNVYATNSGLYRILRITVYGSPTSDLTLSKVIGVPIALGATAGWVSKFPKMKSLHTTWISVSNAASSNTATVSVVLERFTGSRTISDTNLFTSQSVAASVESTSTGLYTGACTRLNIYAKNTGTSTNCTFTFYGSYNSK